MRMVGIVVRNRYSVELTENFKSASCAGKSLNSFFAVTVACAGIDSGRKAGECIENVVLSGNVQLEVSKLFEPLITSNSGKAPRL